MRYSVFASVWIERTIRLVNECLNDSFVYLHSIKHVINQ